MRLGRDCEEWGSFRVHVVQSSVTVYQTESVRVIQSLLDLFFRARLRYGVY